MARCVIGPKKLRNKIQPLMPSGWVATKALVRGGWEHGSAMVFALGPADEKIIGFVNYLTAEAFTPHTGTLSTWV